MEALWRVLGVPAIRKKDNEQRIVRIYESKRVLIGKRDEYRLGIKNRIVQAKIFMREGNRSLARSELLMVRIYRKDLDMVGEHLLQLERLIAARERASLLAVTASTTKEIMVWMRQTVETMNKETVDDQREDMDEMLQTIDRVQFQMAQSNDAAVKQTLSPAEMRAIDDDLDELCESDQEEETEALDDEDNTVPHDDDVYEDVVLPRRKAQSSLLLAEEDD